MFNHPWHFFDLNFQINGYVMLAYNKLAILIRDFGTVSMWQPHGAARPFQLRNALYVPDINYSMVGEGGSFRNGFARQTMYGGTQRPFIMSIDLRKPSHEVTVK